MFAKVNRPRLVITCAAIAVAFVFIPVHFVSVSVAAHQKTAAPAKQNADVERPSSDESSISVSGAVPPKTIQGPTIYLTDDRLVPTNYITGRSSNIMSQEGTTALSMTRGDLDADGIEDLVVGYGTSSGGGAIAVQRGNLDAFAPQSEESFQAIGREEFPSPFRPEAETLDVPISPDFLALGNFTGNGGGDLAIASRDGNALYIFPGDGEGGFGVPQQVTLPGAITALAAGDLGNSAGFNTLVVGIRGTSKSFSLIVLNSSVNGVTPAGSFGVDAEVSNIQFGRFGGVGADAAFLAGGQVLILRSSVMQVVPVSLPIQVRAFALGSFIFDRTGGLQIALLTSDGTLHIAASTKFDPRPRTLDEVHANWQANGGRGFGNPLHAPRTLPQKGFKIVERIASAAPFAPGQMPVLFRTRISDHGADDVMALNPSAGQLAVISHPDVTPGATTFLPAQISRRPYSGSPIAALSMRTNIDGRPGVVTLHAGQLAPAVMMPLPDPTFTVNRTDDPTPISPIANACNGVANDCSLREAILRANATAGTDTVSVPAGTYTLTLPRPGPVNYNGTSGTLEILDSVNIVGAGQGTTIIRAGTTNTNGVDMLMAVNEDIAVLTNATASISNLTLQFGRNRGSVAGFDGDGGCLEFDTGGSGTANLVLDHVTFSDCSTTDGNGAGIAIFNASSGSTGGAGLATVTNSIFQNGSVAEVNTNAAGSGGGIWVADLARMSLSNSQVINNNANQINGTGRGVGGGIFIFSAGSGSRQTVLHSNTITGNHASGDGGGIWSTSNLLIDNGGAPTGLTLISGNTAGGNGGGIHYHAVSPDAMTISKATITGNTATGAGGGIDSGEPTLAHSFTMSFSRLAGNTAASASNLNNNHSTATVTNNWWGTNTPSTTIVNSNSGTTTFDPFVVLTHTGNPGKIRINQSSTLTGDMSKDNHGSGAALTGNLDVIVGLPITFVSGPLGSIPQAQPETLNASGQATATFNAGGTSGRANPTATADQAGALANDSLIASATEATSTVTITTVGAHGFSTGQTVVISGVGVAGYNGTFIITGTPTATTFTYTNPSTGLGASSGGTANVGIVILGPPQITKSFGASTIPVNGTTTVNFSINNPNVVAINGSFTDTLPVGLQVAPTPGGTNTCGGTVTAAAGSGTISFSNNLTPVGTCLISVNITGTLDNQYTNSVQILSTDAGNGNTSSANLTVINPPSIAKAFGAATIPLNGTASLTVTLSSTNQNVSINGTAFTDSLPAGLVVANPPSVGGTCTGTVTAVAGASSIGLAGQTLTPGTSCTVIVNIQGTTAGVKNNSVQATSTNAGSSTIASASITVVAPPTIAKAFGAPGISVNGPTGLTFTVTNPNATVGLSGVAFSDTLPAGLVISTPNGLTGSCGAGTITATAGAGVISLSGGTIAASGSCTFAANVTGTTSGVKNNTTGSVTSTNGGTGLTASTSMIVNKANTTASINSDTPDPSVIGQSVAVNFHVSSGTGSAPTAPTGNVTVSDGTNSCTGSINGSGDGSCNITFASVGSKSLTATYAGDSNFNASPASAVASHTVNKGDATIFVSSDNNPSITGQTVTFTAMISATSPAVGAPTGTIQFMDGATNIGSAQTIVGGMASVSTSSLTAGTHTITTQYSGDGNFNTGSNSLSGGQVVNASAQWTGSVDSDWNNPANWSTGVVPAPSNSAVIPSIGVTNNPVIGGVTDITIVDLTIDTGRSLTINNTRTLTINGVLSMNGDDIDATGGLLFISDTGSISRTAGIVLGTLQKAFAAPELFAYPVGTTGAFSPVDVNVTNGPGVLSVLAHTGTAPANPPLDPNKMLQRYWTLSGSGITTDITFHYLDADVPGTSTESQYNIFRIISGGTALRFQPNGTSVLLDTTNNTFTVKAIQNFSDWTAGNPLEPTAASVDVSGRVMDADGRGVYLARVMMIDSSGNSVFALTNPFGYFHFTGVQAGSTYIVTVTSKHGTYQPRAITVNEDLVDLNFFLAP